MALELVSGADFGHTLHHFSSWPLDQTEGGALWNHVRGGAKFATVREKKKAYGEKKNAYGEKKKAYGYLQRTPGSF